MFLRHALKRYANHTLSAGGNGIKLWDYEGHKKYWHGTVVSDTPGQSHFKCMMVSNFGIDKDGQITRWELLCITRMIYKRLNMKRYIDHMVIPVCFVSSFSVFFFAYILTSGIKGYGHILHRITQRPYPSCAL